MNKCLLRASVCFKWQGWFMFFPLHNESLVKTEGLWTLSLWFISSPFSSQVKLTGPNRRSAVGLRKEPWIYDYISDNDVLRSHFALFMNKTIHTDRKHWRINISNTHTHTPLLSSFTQTSEQINLKSMIWSIIRSKSCKGGKDNDKNKAK